MKKLKVTALIGAMLLTWNSAFGQTESGSTISKITAGGYNQVNISYASQSFHHSMKIGEILGSYGADIDDNYSPDISLQGFGLEYIRGFKVSKKLPMYVEAGLNLNFTFGNQMDFAAQHIGFNIPISYAYKFNIKNKFAIKPYLGIDFKVSILGRTELDSGSEDVEWGNWFDEEYNNPTWKRFNLGWHIGADFQYSKYNLGLEFISDITKIASNPFFKVSNNGFALKLGYIF